MLIPKAVDAKSVPWVKPNEPLPRRWPWNPQDKRTWKYIDFIVRGNVIVKWIENPDFAYKHLDI
jgi:hypothetical protein